jgi:hypothetical protein
MNFRQILTYGLMAIAAMGLILGIKACSNPSANQPSSPPAAVSSDASSIGKAKININAAILSELDQLEAQLGVPALSHKIQASRPYGSVEDLVSKQVISQQQFDQIKNQLTIEDIVLTGAAKDVDYITKLALMKGHMLVAGELLALNQPAQAEPHLGHPVEEIYVDIQAQLPERKVADFKDPLMQVQDLVKSKPMDPQVKRAYDKALAAIDQAIAAIPASQQQSPTFAMQVINGLLETATAEYTAAISNGKVKEAIEYQDSRGFVLEAQNLYKAAQPQLKANAAQSNELKNALLTLQTAWPAPIPPATPVLTPDEVATQVKQIEKMSTAIANASAL